MAKIMKTLSNFFLLFSLHLLFFSCVPVHHQNPLTHFTEKQTERIKQSKWIDLETYDVLKPDAALRYGDDYIIIDNTRANVIKKINFSTNKFVSGVNFGNGPNELNMIGQLRKVKDKLLINDISLKKIFKITVNQDSLLQLELYQAINYDKKLYLFDYHGNNMIATGMFGDFWIGCIDIRSNKLLSAIDFPKFEETSSLQGMYKSSLYISSHISISPNEKKVVVATQDAGVISLSDISENRLTEYKQINYYPPGFRVVNANQGGTVAKSKDCKVGFCGIDCDDTYIYSLYSGRTANSHGELSHHCENLLVYDWDGNPIKRYILNIPM
jgi:DNA-binding beta-propeller fold protein YncE